MTGFVYAIASDEGAVKIGYARDPVRRLSELNVAHAGRLKLVGVVRGTKADERAAHKLLYAYRVRGEWFRNVGPVAAMVGMMPAPAPRPARVAIEKMRPSPCVALVDFMAREGLSFDEMGRRLGVSHEAVRKWVSGERTPRRRYMAAIVRLSGGTITPNDFLPRDSEAA